ncbi:amidohydrolase [Persicobacter psychrovividus]
MKKDLKIATVQADLYWEDIDANLAHLEELISAQAFEADLIVLPEMFNTGFTHNQAVAEHMNGKTFRWMKLLATQHNCVVTGSYIIKEGGAYYNRLIWMKADGSFLFYDKRHLFRMGKEHLAFHAGDEKLIVELEGWRICPLICYDLRFPIWSRNISHPGGSMDYDVLIYPSSWPESRHHVWNTLLPARAIENQAYTIGVNRIGQDGNGLNYQGGSQSYGPKGFSIHNQGTAQSVEVVTLSYEVLQGVRDRFPAHLDQDRFEIHPDLDRI